MVLQWVVVVEAVVEEEVVEVEAVVRLHRDWKWNLMNDDGYYAMNDNLNHHPFVAEDGNVRNSN